MSYLAGLHFDTTRTALGSKEGGRSAQGGRCLPQRAACLGCQPQRVVRRRIERLHLHRLLRSRVGGAVRRPAMADTPAGGHGSGYGANVFNALLHTSDLKELDFIAMSDIESCGLETSKTSYSLYNTEAIKR